MLDRKSGAVGMLVKSALVLSVTLASSTVLSTSTFAETTLSIYGGANFSPHSRVEYHNSLTNTTTTTAVGWDGASFKMPPYYGVRATWWLDSAPEFGVALDFTHAKVEAAPLPAGFTTLEFTDGINYLTVNAMYRWDMGNGFTPYVGLGAGLTIPHVEVEAPGILQGRTFEYQVTGLAAQALAGVSYQFDDNWSMFGEIKTNYGVVNARLFGGDTLKTNIINNQVIFGFTYKLF
ncbi:MAG: outer membrane beta-barrel protein [Rhizobiaceae bacterium]